MHGEGNGWSSLSALPLCPVFDLADFVSSPSGFLDAPVWGGGGGVGAWHQLENWSLLPESFQVAGETKWNRKKVVSVFSRVAYSRPASQPVKLCDLDQATSPFCAQIPHL